MSFVEASYSTSVAFEQFANSESTTDVTIRMNQEGCCKTPYEQRQKQRQQQQQQSKLLRTLPSKVTPLTKTKRSQSSNDLKGKQQQQQKPPRAPLSPQPSSDDVTPIMKNRKNRTVNDFGSADDLRKAMMSSCGCDPLSVSSSSSSSKFRSKSIGFKSGDPLATTVADTTEATLDNKCPNLDWVLPSIDPATTEAQSVEEEMIRLQVLKSYLILDADREKAFDRITGVACRVFNVPVALISLVDLGRQWFLSNTGLPEGFRETPREQAFCAHSILLKSPLDVLIVPDATQDGRFTSNPLVTGSPGIRFYAGAPLISPEGYKLGTCCIISDQTRPEGLTFDEQSTLRDLAGMAVDALVDRRNRFHLRKNTEALAYEAHSLLTPLSGLQLSLSIMNEDEELHRQLSPEHKDMLATCASSANSMIKILKTMDSLKKGVAAELNVVARFQEAELSKQKNNDDTKLGHGDNDAEDEETADKASSRSRSSSCSGDHGSSCKSLNKSISSPSPLFRRMHKSSLSQPNFPIPQPLSSLRGEKEKSLPLTNMKDLVKNLNVIMAQVPNKVPLVIRLHPNVPIMIVSDELKLFRSCLNLLSSAASRTFTGWVQLHIFVQKRELVFECSDTGETVQPEIRKQLFEPSSAEDGNLRLCMFSVSRLIGSIIGGRFGYRPTASAGSVFWFTIPVIKQTFPPSAEAAAAKFLSLVRQPMSSMPSCIQETPCPSTMQCWEDLLRLHNDLDNEGSSTASSESSSTTLNSLPTSNPAADDDGDSEDYCGASQSSLKNIEESFGRLTELSQKETAAAAAAVVESQQPQLPRKRRALVIDDSLVIRKSVAMAFKKLDFEVTLAVDGLDGLNKMKENTFDLVLCDFLMPVMDGFDCVKQYREWESANRCWFRQLIVGISAHATESVGSQGLDAGMDDFQPKPLALKAMKELGASDTVKSKTKELDDFDKLKASAASRKSIRSAAVKAAATETNENYRGATACPGKLSPFSKLTRRRSRGLDLAECKMNAPMVTRQNMCLFASSNPSSSLHQVVSESVESEEWKIVVVQTEQETLKELQSRNWDAVLIDDEMESTSHCISIFREWERKNRVNRQNNVSLLVDLPPLPQQQNHSFAADVSTIHPPSGFDTVVSKNAGIWNELSVLMKKPPSMSIILDA